MKTTTLTTAVAVGLVFGSAAFAEGKNPAQAISQNVEKNGAFTSINDGPHVTNGNVNFGNGGAMRSFNGKATDHAAPNSAVDTDDTRDGTRVEPRGLYDG